MKTPGTRPSLFACPPVTVGDQVFHPQALATVDRLDCVRRCSDAATLTAALDVPGLQVSVRRAIETRLRKLAP